VEKCIFLALDSSKKDEKYALGNGKSPSVQDSNGEVNLAITILLLEQVSHHSLLPLAGRIL
jgi:hypothetical protein